MPVAIAEIFLWIDNLAETVVNRAKEWDEDAIEAVLDSRDTDPFDADWVRTDNALEAHKALIAPDLCAHIDAHANDLRKQLFVAILRASGSSDLAGYVSDDFEMICGGLACGFVSEFLFSLAAAYVEGWIPDNSMKVVDKNPGNFY